MVAIVKNHKRAYQSCTIKDGDLQWKSSTPNLGHNHTERQAPGTRLDPIDAHLDAWEWVWDWLSSITMYSNGTLLLPLMLDTPLATRCGYSFSIISDSLDVRYYQKSQKWPLLKIKTTPKFLSIFNSNTLSVIFDVSHYKTHSRHNIKQEYS